MNNWLTARIQAEWQDLDVKYPPWLIKICDDELYYTVALIIIGTYSFTLGLFLGWLRTL